MMKCNAERGFSLVELMIALVIGLILIAGVLQVFVGSTVTYSMQSGLSKIQENGRFAMSFIVRDLRQAGYFGCSREADINNVTSSAIDAFLNIENPILGDASTGSASYQRTSLADVIEVKFAEVVSSCDIESHNTAGREIQCEANHNFNNTEVMIATDCLNIAVFQKNGAHTSRIEHPVGVGTAFDRGSVMRLQTHGYYIANNTLGEPALYRESIASGAASTIANELVEGIEDMQVLYGEDTDNDRVVNYYVPFNEVNDAEDVLSIRVSLLVRSIEDNIVQGSQTVVFNGATVNRADGHLRKVFTTTVALRNRL